MPGGVPLLMPQMQPALFAPSMEAEPPVPLPHAAPSMVPSAASPASNAPQNGLQPLDNTRTVQESMHAVRLARLAEQQGTAPAVKLEQPAAKPSTVTSDAETKPQSGDDPMKVDVPELDNTRTIQERMHAIRRARLAGEQGLAASPRAPTGASSRRESAQRR